MAKIVFFGTPAFARAVLEIVMESHQVLAIVTQPDRPFGRKQELKISEVKDLALSHQIPLFQPERLDEQVLRELKAFEADFFLVVAFGQIFPKFFLQSHLCINIHASILPQFRGASPLQEMILQDRKKFGVTAMKMEEGLDCGEILGMSILQTQEDLDLCELSSKMAKMGGNLAVNLFKNFELLAPLKQRDCEASLCQKIKKERGEISFQKAREIFVKFLAFMPWPGVFLSNGLKLLKFELNSTLGIYQEGEILKIEKDYVLLGCKEGSLRLYEVQPPSRQKMPVLDYMRGKHLRLGDIFC